MCEYDVATHWCSILMAKTHTAYSDSDILVLFDLQAQLLLLHGTSNSSVGTALQMLAVRQWWRLGAEDLLSKDCRNDNDLQLQQHLPNPAPSQSCCCCSYCVWLLLLLLLLPMLIWMLALS